LFSLPLYELGGPIVIFLIVIAAFLAAGIIPTLLITKFYDKKPINPYLPAFVLWLLGILNYLYSKIISHLQDTGIDPIGELSTLSIMAIAVISSSISWIIAEVWARQKCLAKNKLRNAIMVLNILTIVLPLLLRFIVIIMLYWQVS